MAPDAEVVIWKAKGKTYKLKYWKPKTLGFL